MSLLLFGLAVVAGAAAVKGISSLFKKKESTPVINKPNNGGNNNPTNTWEEDYKEQQRKAAEAAKAAEAYRRRYEEELSAIKEEAERERRRNEEALRREKERVRRDNERIIEQIKRAEWFKIFNEQVAIKAKAYENDMCRQYCLIYSDIIAELEKSMDVKPIRDFVDKKCHVFDDQMRNEVSNIIHIGNRELEDLMNDYSKPFETYKQNITNYTNKVYYGARDNLIVTLDKIIKETNAFIDSYANKCIQDMEEKAQERIENLSNLSKEGDARDSQLLKSASEYATLELIKEFANQKVS